MYPSARCRVTSDNNIVNIINNNSSDALVVGSQVGCKKEKKKRKDELTQTCRTIQSNLTLFPRLPYHTLTLT